MSNYILDAPTRCIDPWSWFNRIRVKRVFELQEPEGLRVLDYGCGWGTIAYWAVREKAKSVYVWDPDPEAVRWTIRYPGTSYTSVIMPADVAYAADVFEHMTDDEVQHALDTVPVDKWVVYCPNRTSWLEKLSRDKTHIGMRTLGEFLSLVFDGKDLAHSEWSVTKARWYGWRYFPWFNKRRWGVVLKRRNS